jgi:hypothetical protein
MNTSLRASRVVVVAVGLLLALVLSACGSASSGAGGGTGASSPTVPATAGGGSSGSGSGSGSGSAPAGSGTATAGAPTTAPPTAPPGAVPPGGPVPDGFAATSVTFVSPREAFVLGTAPCADAPCTSIVRTLDRGVSWRGLPAPVVPLGNPQTGTAGPVAWGIRFADPDVGFVFGNGLWETTDGGERWVSAAAPGGSIISLAVIDGQVLALTTGCKQDVGCGQTGTLLRRPLAGGAWRMVTEVLNPSAIATQARVAAVLQGTSVLVTANGGRTTVKYATPCATPGVAVASSVAVTGPDGLALLCAGNAGMGSVDKTVYVSEDLGAHWTQAGSPPRGGDPVSSSAATPARLVVAAASGASELYYSGDGGAQWSTAYYAGDGGQGFGDLGFTSATDGVVIHGPVFTDSNAEGSPGQLLLTSDGGASWQLVSF